MLNRQMFRWFFGNFQIIALPLLAMFWVGCCERIFAYGLTPWRISMVLCGLTMTVFVTMFFFKKWGKYLFATAFSVALLLPFALVPELEMKKLSERWTVEEKYTDMAESSNYRDLMLKNYNNEKTIDIAKYNGLIIITKYFYFYDDSIALREIDFRISKNTFVSDQLRKISYPEDGEFDEEYLKNNVEEFLIYDTDKFRILFRSIDLQYDYSSRKITCRTAITEAVLIK